MGWIEVTECGGDPLAADRATADFLKALASDTRQKVMRQFAAGAELTVGEIAERCALRPSTTSEHLSLLRRGGLVLSRKEGKQVYYRADGATMAVRLEALREYLAHCCPPGRGDRPPAPVAPSDQSGPPRRAAIPAITDGSTQ